LPRVLLVAVAAVALMALSPVGEWRKGDPAVERCVAEYDAIDAVVRQAGVADAGHARIEGFPYFRVDRFLASYDFAALQPAERTEWIDRLMAADKAARTIEIGNLPAYQRGILFSRLGRDPLQTVEACADTLRKFDHERKEAHRALPPRARVADTDPPPSRPSPWSPQRLAALTGAAPVDGALTAFEPATPLSMSPHAVKLLIDNARSPALKIPQPDDEASQRLIAAFAPVWIVTGRPDEALVMPEWRDGGIASSSELAAVYAAVTHTRRAGKVLLQLNYVAWFRAQPLDGIVWRVTLGADGRPLAYDTIRTDGSAYLLIAGAGLDAPGAPRLADAEEGARLAVAVDAASRTVIHVGPWTGQTRNSYVLTEYDRLLRLYRGAGETHSLFGPDGAMPGGGAAAPRQMGHHNLGAAGYFDSPGLLERAARRPGG
jgi:hypothetical protein